MSRPEDTGANDFILKLREFYASAQLQHKVSFWASIAAGALGLLIVLFAIGVYLTTQSHVTDSVIMIVSGVIAEFIAAVFFYIHNRNIEQVDRCIEKLVKLQDTQLAINLVEKMPDNNRAYMYMSIINVLVLRNEPQREISADLVRALREKSAA